MHWFRRAVAAIAVVLAFVAGYRLAPNDNPNHDGHGGAEQPHAGESAAATTFYTCSMHPQIRQDEPGKCPICFMDLVPTGEDSASGSAPILTLSESARALADIETVTVERRFVDMPVRLSGKLDFDETRVRTISAWSGGRLDRLFVNYTGVPVDKGEHLVEIFSPELYAAQAELIQARRLLATMSSSQAQEFSRQAAAKTVEAAREKLRLLGLADTAIEAVETADVPRAHSEILSPLAGTVITKHVNEGDYVQVGAPLFTVADLGRLWVRLDAYESALPFIRYGQAVHLRTEAYGDELFAATITFIDPVLDPTTRSVSVRAIVENPDGRLRPNMFVRGVVKVRVGARGEVLADSLAGKWISPMHPEIVKDEPGFCDVCGMALVRAEALGYTATSAATAPLVIPSSAVLLTGARAVVYLREPAQDKPTFRGVEIELGPRAGDVYVVRSGLAEGDQVVARGAFKIDSALQILAKPSMMSPPAESHGDPAAAESHAGHAAANQEGSSAGESPAALAPQTTCPIMGGTIDPDLFVDVQGQRIRVCCPGCIEEIRKAPEAAFATLQRNGQYAESLQTVCTVMGGAINPDLYVEYNGRRLYVCCEGCLEEVQNNPAEHARRVAEQVSEEADAAKTDP